MCEGNAPQHMFPDLGRFDWCGKYPQPPLLHDPPPGMTGPILKGLLAYGILAFVYIPLNDPDPKMTGQEVTIIRAASIQEVRARISKLNLSDKFAKYEYMQPVFFWANSSNILTKA